MEEMLELVTACGYYINEHGKCVRESSLQPNKEAIIDSMVDLQVVLLGTAHIMGLFARSPSILTPRANDEFERVPNNLDKYSVFEEAYNRVWLANMRKEKCETAAESKRGFAIDLKKPEGWQEPRFEDLVEGLFGYCLDCNCALAEPSETFKCGACLADK
jgi:hypothetical protein